MDHFVVVFLVHCMVIFYQATALCNKGVIFDFQNPGNCLIRGALSWPPRKLDYCYSVRQSKIRLSYSYS